MPSHLKRDRELRGAGIIHCFRLIILNHLLKCAWEIGSSYGLLKISAYGRYFASSLSSAVNSSSSASRTARGSGLPGASGRASHGRGPVCGR